MTVTIMSYYHSKSVCLKLADAVNKHKRLLDAPHGFLIGLCSVLRPLQHSIGYMGDGFTGQKTQPTVSKY